MPYANAYPALPPVADAGAQAILHDTAAPAIAVGDPLDDESLDRAFFECQTREAAAGVTKAEVNQVRKRQHVVLHEQAMDEFNVIAPAPTAGAAINAALAPLTNQVTALGVQVAPMQDTLSRTRNEQLQAKNVAIFRNATRQQLHRYLKVGNVVGPGLQIPRVVHNPIAVALGAEYPNPQFPMTIDGIDTMTAQQMNELSIMMNNDFGVARRDSLATCRIKLRDFLLFGDV